MIYMCVYIYIFLKFSASFQTSLWTKFPETKISMDDIFQFSSVKLLTRV